MAILGARYGSNPTEYIFCFRGKRLKVESWSVSEKTCEILSLDDLVKKDVRKDDILLRADKNRLSGEYCVQPMGVESKIYAFRDRYSVKCLVFDSANAITVPYEGLDEIFANYDYTGLS